MYLLPKLEFVLLLFITISYGTTSNTITKEDTLKSSWSIIAAVLEGENSIRHCCSGTVLSESYVLTSADCARSLSDDLSSADVIIVAGTTGRSDSTRVFREIDHIIIHPNWTNDHHSWIHNIALLHLSSPLDSNANRYFLSVDHLATSNIWSDLRPHPFDTILLTATECNFIKMNSNRQASVQPEQVKVSLVDMDNSICNRLVHNADQQFCGRPYPDSTDSCNYKSGEPIFQWNNKRWIQIGVISLVVKETNESCLIVSTRLSSYHEWITSILNFKSASSFTSESAMESTENHTITYECNVYTTSCGCSIEDVKLSSPARILDGEDAVPYSWTMVVSVRLNDSDEHSCGGSILTDTYILTSAHCVDGASVMDISIAAGMHDRILDYAIIRYAYDVYIHPDWNARNGTYENDIAIILVLPPLSVQSDEELARSCVPYFSSIADAINYPLNGSHLAAVGWGATKNGSNILSTTLRQASVYVMNSDDPSCLESLDDSERQFCAGTGRGNPCQGDSGSPIFQWKSTYWEQVGITSYGGKCDHTSASSVYTRLAYYISWIESVIDASLTTTTPKSAVAPTSYNCDKTSSCGCGQVDVRLSSSRIVGGENAVEDSWPMIVSIRLDGSEDHSCGGTILSESYILTAAHCFRQLSKVDPTEITIAAGMTNRSDPSQIIRRVERIYMHPNYTNMPRDYRHDIAILRIDQPLMFESNSTVTRTCIHRIDPPMLTDEYPKGGAQLAVIGWGALFSGVLQLPEILQQAQIFSIDNDESICSNNINDTKIQFCAGLFEGGKDSCQGDSGGPIFQWTGQHWEQVGIVSHGKGCALPNFPGIYTRLSYYYSWITEILKQGGEHLEPDIQSSTTANTLQTTSLTASPYYSSSHVSNSTRWATSSVSKTTTSIGACKYEIIVFQIGIFALLLLLNYMCDVHIM